MGEESKDWNIYALGDINDIESLFEVKLAHTSELHAEYVAHHIESCLSHRGDICTYDYYTLGDSSTDTSSTSDQKREAPINPYCVSLGRYDGSLSFFGFSLNGIFAGIAKWVICWTKCNTLLHNDGWHFGFWLEEQSIPPISTLSEQQKTEFNVIGDGTARLFYGIRVYSIGYRVSNLVWDVSNALCLFCLLVLKNFAILSSAKEQMKQFHTNENKRKSISFLFILIVCFIRFLLLLKSK
ncbi:hypothetical protein RFI_39374 [Reticulomyxa filosa]|uniref:Uncharacterized protein n=1 Tax=Reticulomyxa filosa TaxID=46433 RepID=X6L9D2_RETFI|nr:hypothetical protein RFI_39374 [Reticulomyxa filosa]|eukprot:ETN98143.1 hypothetical protein RFI_39374 [Reticulomyxa filosa]